MTKTSEFGAIIIICINIICMIGPPKNEGTLTVFMLLDGLYSQITQNFTAIEKKL